MAKKQRLQHSVFNNNKIIVLPLIIQKQIINYLFDKIKSALKDEYRFISDNDMKSKCKNYALVNQFWFGYSQKTIVEFYRHIYSNEKKEEENDEKEDDEDDEEDEEDKEEGKDEEDDDGDGDEMDYGTNSNNKYNLLRKDSIKKIRIDFSYIKNKSVINEINSIYKSLESIEIYCNEEYYIGDSIGSISNLELLKNKEIFINFNLNINNHANGKEDEEYEMGPREKKGKPFSFKTDKFKVEYDNCDYKYPYIYYLVKTLNPKKLMLSSGDSISDCRHHLQQYHSIAKLNQNYQSVVTNDFIPLYSLYRFLQSPNLTEFKFNLQYHFISKLYDDEEGNSGKSSNKQFTFDEMDEFEFKSFESEEICIGNVEIESRDDEKGTYYGINEDDQKYCAFNNYDEHNESIPPYSKQLWNECMKLLKNNKTITKLSITCQDCVQCDWDRDSTVYNINFLNDFADMFANNKTITSLSLQYNEGYIGSEICDENKELIITSIISMLDRNTTLKHLSIDYYGEDIDFINEIKKQTKNTNCEIVKP